VLTRIELEESRSWAKREEIWSVKLERKKERKKEIHKHHYQPGAFPSSQPHAEGHDNS